jgi:succinyl-CoA synthetase beta subunit
MEYQAKELFAKHDVPVTLGVVIEEPDQAAAAGLHLGLDHDPAAARPVA